MRLTSIEITAINILRNRCCGVRDDLLYVPENLYYKLRQTPEWAEAFDQALYIYRKIRRERYAATSR